LLPRVSTRDCCIFCPASHELQQKNRGAAAMTMNEEQRCRQFLSYIHAYRICNVNATNFVRQCIAVVAEEEARLAVIEDEDEDEDEDALGISETAEHLQAKSGFGLQEMYHLYKKHVNQIQEIRISPCPKLQTL
jgi:hypothetical protein